MNEEEIIDRFIQVTWELYEFHTDNWAGPTMDWPLCMEQAKAVILNKNNE